MTLVNDQVLEFQLGCPETNPENCKTCSFFVGCERKYSLKNNDNEYCLELAEAIILFSSDESFYEFCQTFSYNGELQELTYDEILRKCDEKDLELIVFN